MTDPPSFDPTHDPFEQIYQAVGDDLERVPWASLAPRAELVSWLDGAAAPPWASGARGLVIACGLGDDAEELARRGLSVTAFDFSPTAVDWCRRRFPGSPVSYVVADLLALAPAWAGAFDLVVEVNTVQSLVPERHPAGIAAIAGTVAPGGALFVRCTGRADDDPVEHRPWPLSRRELAGFVAQGLVETSFTASLTPKGTQFVATYRRRSRDTPIRTGV